MIHTRFTPLTLMLLIIVATTTTTSATLFTTTATATATPSSTDSSFVLNVLHVNDHHSRLYEQTFPIPEAALPTLTNTTRRVRFGGYPRLVRLFRQLKNAHPNVLKIHAGDAITGSELYSIFGVTPDVELMHQVCFDVFNIGNHEFDDGDAVLANFVTQLTDIK
jgi:5'-nucleotidase / UDP-sugar diphosphatase